jgi:O-antigen/teichoic acid export membrane protein
VNTKVKEPMTTASFNPASPAQRSELPLRSVVSNWAGLVVNALLSFVLTPLLVHGLGDVFFAMWMLVTSLLESSWLLDFGMRTTVFRFVARYQGGKQRDALDETFVSGFAISLAAAGIILLLSCASLFVLPSLFAITGDAAGTFRWLLVLSGASVAISFCAQFLGTYLCATRRFDLNNLTSAGTGLVRAALIVAALHTHHGVLFVAAMALACSLLSLAVNASLLRVADPALSIHPRNIKLGRIRQLLGFSSSAFLGNAGDQLRFFVDSIVIGRVLTVALITPFNIAGRLVMLFRQLALALASPFAGVMSELEGQQKQAELQSYFLLATRLTSLLSVFISLMLLVNGRPLIGFWVGKAYSHSYGLLVVLLAGYCLMLAQQPSADFLIAKGRHRFRGWWTLAEGFANLGLSIYWGHRYGLIGIALGTAVPMIAVQVLVQPWYTLYVAAIPLRRYFKEALLPPLLVGVVFITVCALAQPWRHSSDLLHFVFALAWQCTLLLLLAVTVGLRRGERSWMMESVRRMRSGAGVRPSA